MKSVAQDTYGSTEVLRLQDHPRPEPADREVLVQVRAAGVDAGLWHLMTGTPYAVRLGFGLRKPRQAIRGRDVAGRVEAVGKDVTAFRPGDEVFGTCEGSLAEYAAARADRLVLKPASISFEEAAVTPISGLTALQALRDQARVEAGQRVLVIGAAGGVGSFAVQFAKAFGAHVTGVCRTDKRDFVRSLGADDVIDYTREDITARPDRHDVILDIAGNRALSHLRRALTPRGTLVIVGGMTGGPVLGGLERNLAATLLSPLVSQRLTAFVSRERHEDLQTLAGYLGTGAIVPAVDRAFALVDAAAAIRYLADGHVRGKVAVTV